MASAKQKAWRAKFGRLYGHKKKTRAKKIKHKMRVAKRHRRNRAVVKTRNHRGHGMFGGINKKGALLQALALYFGNFFGEARYVVDQGFDMFAIRDSLYHWRTKNPLGFYAYEALLWKYGDCGVLNALGLTDITIHRKSAAINLWSLSQWEVLEPLSNAIDHARKNEGGTKIASDVETLVKGGTVPLAVAGVAWYKYGAPISVKGVTE